jgi:hypothetical protein
VRIINVGSGPDYGDKILLININRRTWGLQYPSAGHRRDEIGDAAVRSEYLREGIPQAIWDTALPLLRAAGVF